ncbi:hypothetical protein K466DRAFT_182593 [Polyporus arcularius HHB13444]|uniref:Uncharacterized protein n=1 Tax=Polyporus arcularius HHB13444 TaxID=1314778 RepID=A0A5C3P8M8_9APHY|nr:hypothetical protein K466DRAFT_182593 [Polyporus arcularius HHB13444]
MQQHEVEVADKYRCNVSVENPAPALRPADGQNRQATHFLSGILHALRPVAGARHHVCNLPRPKRRLEMRRMYGALPRMGKPKSRTHGYIGTQWEKGHGFTARHVGGVRMCSGKQQYDPSISAAYPGTYPSNELSLVLLSVSGSLLDATWTRSPAHVPA